MKSTLILIRLGLLAVMVSALAGCGGSDGAPGTAGAPGAPGANGVNVQVASNLTATQWAALQPTIDPASVSITINSPPVVKFTVKDQYGEPLVGLGTKSGANLNNAYFTLAKLIPVTGGPSVWRSYLVTKVATSTTTGAVADSNGAYWVGTFPTMEREGTLVDNGDGTYQYTFARDIKQAATIVTGLTDDATHIKADLGDVSYDPSATTRLGIVIKGNQPGSSPAVAMAFPTNVTFDFRPDGGAITATRDIVQRGSCDGCHAGKVIGHGDRRDPKLCVTCHTDQTKYGFVNVTEGTNADGSPTLTSVYMRTTTGEAAFTYPRMIHKTHMGNELIKTGYNLNGHCNSPGQTGYVSTKAVAHQAQCFNLVGFPQDQRNCTKCHDGSATKSDGSVNLNQTKDGDNWKNVPSRLACGACHDGIDFATGLGITLADRDADVLAKNPVGTTQTGHGGGTQTSDANCSVCHAPGTTVGGDVEILHRTTIPSLNNPIVKAGLDTFQYKTSGVTINTSNQVVVKFQVLENGTAVALPVTGYTGGPSFVVAYATAQDGIAAPSDWNSGHDSASLADVSAGANGNSLTLTDAATNTYTAVIASSSLSFYSTVHSLVLPADAKMVTVLLAGGYKQTSSGTTVPGIPAMMAATGNTPDGKANVARRVIFAKEKCESCHDRLGTSPNFHSGNYSIPMCPACHTPNQGGNTGWSASFRVWVHGIHSAEKRTVPFTWHAITVDNNFSKVLYPGVLKKCEACHLPGTYDFSASQYTATDAMGKTIVDSMLDVQAATNYNGNPITVNYVPPQFAPVGSGLLAYGLKSGVDYGKGDSIDPASGVIVTQTTQGNNLVSSPITATCSACHDSLQAISHMTTTGYGSFYKARSLVTAPGATKEQCLICHGSGRIADIKVVHAQ